MRARCLDVHDLEPPLPLQRALAALQTLASDEYLRLHHRREPLPLYAMLPELGFRHRTRTRPDGDYDIVIWRRDADAPELDA
jgi:hypothetical protein